MNRRRLSLVILAAGLWACGGDVNGPPDGQPGWLTVDLATTQTGVGGLVLRITGGPVDSVRMIVAYDAVARAATAADWTVLVVGRPLAAGALGTIRVPDVTQADRYAVQVLQAAARGTWQQLAPQDFSVVVRAP